VVGAAAKRQAAAEVIMLTHNRDLHEVNLGWHPRREFVLWRPGLQQAKCSQPGVWNGPLPQRRGRVGALQDLVAAHAPWIRVRYAF
jgi:hypothetical protein